MPPRLPREALLWRGEHEPEVQNAILANVGPGAVVYDIGAHVGTTALGTALLVGDLGLVVAFDGDPENIARLQEHCARNGLENRLRVVHAAVWSRASIDRLGLLLRLRVAANAEIQPELVVTLSRKTLPAGTYAVKRFLQQPFDALMLTSDANGNSVFVRRQAIRVLWHRSDHLNCIGDNRSAEPINAPTP
jgi:hypothetical protein